MAKILFVFLCLLCWEANEGWAWSFSSNYSELYKNFQMTGALNLYNEVVDLREKYEAAKQREQSLSNRTLGAVAMGAGGIGGMMLASGLAEQSAEKKAEMDMAAYLATFKCDYGSGMNVNGGAKNVQIPGSVELMPMYAEYVMLANDLKLRKEQLGLKPGIESEAVLDSATSGLYDDVSNGLTRGVYASLSRALINPEGADAKKWAEQVESAKQKTKTGAVVGGTGVVGGAIGDLIINRDTRSKK